MNTKQYMIAGKDLDLRQMATAPDQKLGDDNQLKKQLRANIKPLKNL